MDSREFTAFGVSHWVALIATATAAIGLIKLERSNVSTSPTDTAPNLPETPL